MHNPPSRHQSLRLRRVKAQLPVDAESTAISWGWTLPKARVQEASSHSQSSNAWLRLNPGDLVLRQNWLKQPNCFRKVAFESPEESRIYIYRLQKSLVHPEAKSQKK